MKEVKHMNVTIFTDGAARGNPDGPGGYGSIIQYRDGSGRLMEKELSGGYPQTTNNRMELMGVIAAMEELSTFSEPCKGIIYSDSRYVVDAFGKHWIDNWKKNGWVTASKTPVKNQDLWNRLLKALEPHQMAFRWVKGHADHPENERCDKLATSAADRVGWGIDDSAEPFQEASDFQEASEWKLFDQKSERNPFEQNSSKSDSSNGFIAISGQASKAPAAPNFREPESFMSAAPGASAFHEPPQTIRIKYLSDKIDRLKPPTNSANWVDLRSAEDVELRRGEYRLIRLGVAMKLPEGYEAHVVPRSSTYKNFGIIQANHHGVIDNAYSGDSDEWMVPVIALRDTIIHLNDRICQFRIERRQPDIIFEEVDRLDEESRGGFGSTGIV